MKAVPVASPQSVRVLIGTLLKDGDASLPTTAQRLGVSQRSLQRQLAMSGTSFSDLIEEVRLETACRLLIQPELSMADIAYRLGYAGPSSFSRIFRRVLKIPPLVYRTQRITGPRRRRSNGASSKVTEAPPVNGAKWQTR